MLSIEWGVDDDGNMLIKDVQKVTEIQHSRRKNQAVYTQTFGACTALSLYLWEKSNSQFKI
jgi:hypothetical protein